jgi:integrase
MEIRNNIIDNTDTNTDTNSNSRIIPFKKITLSKTRYITSDGRPLPRAADPIKDKETVQRILSYFLNSNQTYKYRNHMLFVMGINLGRRCGDLLNLTIDDVYDFSTGTVKDRIYVKEQKTKKTILPCLNEYVKQAILLYLDNLKVFSPDDWLFRSRLANREGEHKITVVQAWRILNDVSKALNLNVHMGTHSMRKTFGYQVWKNNPNGKEALATLMSLFNHSSSDITLRYIGDLQETQDNIINNLSW